MAWKGPECSFSSTLFCSLFSDDRHGDHRHSPNMWGVLVRASQIPSLYKAGGGGVMIMVEPLLDGNARLDFQIKY